MMRISKARLSPYLLVHENFYLDSNTRVKIRFSELLPAQEKLMWFYVESETQELKQIDGIVDKMEA